MDVSQDVVDLETSLCKVALEHLANADDVYLSNFLEGPEQKLLDMLHPECRRHEQALLQHTEMLFHSITSG